MITTAESSKLLTPLMNAIMACDESAALRILNADPIRQVAAVGPFGWTALHVVAMTHALNTHSNRRTALLDRICDAMLKAGANHQVKDAHNQNAMVASQGMAPASLRKHVAEYWKANPAPDTCLIENEDGKIVRHKGPQSGIARRWAKPRWTASGERDAWMDQPDLGINQAA